MNSKRLWKSVTPAIKYNRYSKQYEESHHLYDLNL